MSYIQLNLQSADSFSLISNNFIDYYMTHANGEFVKVYLYLVRLLSSKAPVSVSGIADHFNLTENDICRAIRYWISAGALELNYDANGKLTGITILELEPKPVDENADSLSLDSINLLRFPSMADTKAKIKNATSENKVTSTDAPASNSAAATSNNQPKLPERQAFSPALSAKLRDDDTFSDIIFETETYFGKMLSTKDFESLVYIHDQLGFPTDVIEFLIEYCVSMGKKSLRYAEAVAKNWYTAGVKTVTDAKLATSEMPTLYRSIFRVLGIDRKSPTKEQSDYMNRWHNDWCFDQKIIIEACQRGANKFPSKDQTNDAYRYINGILENWYKNGVKSPSDIAKQDELFQAKKKNSQASASQNSKQYVPKANSFNSFAQTDMSKKLDEMEQLLLDEVNNN